MVVFKSVVFASDQLKGLLQMQLQWSYVVSWDVSEWRLSSLVDHFELGIELVALALANLAIESWEGLWRVESAYAVSGRDLDTRSSEALLQSFEKKPFHLVRVPAEFLQRRIRLVKHPLLLEEHFQLGLHNLLSFWVQSIKFVLQTFILFLELVHVGWNSDFSWSCLHLDNDHVYLVGLVLCKALDQLGVRQVHSEGLDDVFQTCTLVFKHKVVFLQSANQLLKVFDLLLLSDLDTV
jgi:hypothetical protein